MAAELLGQSTTNSNLAACSVPAWLNRGTLQVLLNVEHVSCARELTLRMVVTENLWSPQATDEAKNISSPAGQPQYLQRATPLLKNKSKIMHISSNASLHAKQLQCHMLALLPPHSSSFRNKTRCRCWVPMHLRRSGALRRRGRKRLLQRCEHVCLKFWGNKETVPAFERYP